ncbi:MAG: class II glutamine amidotransferase [Calditrichaeota bacterium]|nr:class II glutamine amidotransferase [Calditrichota bacterium]
MCRFLAFWGKKARRLDYFLIDAPNSLNHQSAGDSSGRPNPDGWGIAYFSDHRPDIIKMSNPAYEDPQFRFIGRQISARILFGHVRRKSYGDVCYENTHPFVKKGWLFMHNGNIPDLEQVVQILQEEVVLPEEYRPKGQTDSEFLFSYVLYLFEIKRAHSVEQKFQILKDIILRIESITPREKFDQLALNFVLANTENLFAYRRNRPLYYRIWGDGILLASEPVDRSPHWQSVEDGSFIVGSKPGEIQVLTRREVQQVNDREWA